jgi:hypothetical protein
MIPVCNIPESSPDRITEPASSRGNVFLPIVLMLVVMTASSIKASGQNQIVTGQITDDNNVAIAGPTVCQINTNNCTNADMNGIFHLLLEPGKEKSLQIRCLGFNPAEVVIDESTLYPLKIVLTPAFMTLESPGQDMVPRIIFRSSWSAEVMFMDFREFSTSLGSFNTEAMDYYAITGPELGVSVHRFYTGFRFGLGNGYSEEHDTLIVDLSNTSFSLNLGYDLINSTRIRITPTISLKLLRLRLQNYRNARKIPLSQYLDERDLELRFNQIVAVAGINIEYLIYNNIFAVSGDYWSLGFSGGYAMKLNRTPWIYSRGNRLITDNEIGLKHFTFGISVSFYTKFK